MPTITLRVRDPRSGREERLLALCDGGSSGLVVTKRAVHRLGVKTWTRKTTVKVIDNVTETNRENCAIELISGSEPLMIPAKTAVVVDSIPVNASSIGTMAAVSKFPFMEGVVIADPPDLNVDLILGSDLAWSFWIPEEVRRGTDLKEPMAIKVNWGWMLVGGDVECMSQISLNYINVDNKTLSECWICKRKLIEGWLRYKRK